jgi:hypothetical protein
MHRIPVAAIAMFVMTSSALSQNCPGGICPSNRAYVRLAPRRVVRYEMAVPVARYYASEPMVVAPPVGVYRAVPYASYSRLNSGRSWSLGWGAFRYSQGRRCQNGRCR